MGAVRANLEEALNARLNLVRGLAAFVKVRETFSEAEFQVFAAALAQGQAGIRSLQLAPNSVVTHVYPLKGNEAAVGHDLMADPARRDAVESAINGRKLVLAGPVSLRQGGFAVIGRLPIFVPAAPGGAAKGERYWGLAIIVIDMEPILANAGILDQSKGMQCALRGKDGLGARGSVFFGDEAVFDADPVVLDVSLPNGSWQLAAVPKGGWTDAWAGRTLLWIGGGATAAIAGCLIFIVLRGSARLRESGELLRGAVDSLQEGFALFDAEDRLVLINGEYARVNPSARDMLERGARFEDLLRANVARGRVSEAIGREEDFIRERLELYRNPKDPILRRFTDGNWYIIREARTPDGGTALTFTDVTTLKRTEKALRESEARMRDLVECTSDWIWHMDADLRFSYYSERFEEVTGVCPEGLLGRTRRELGQGDVDDEKWRRHLADLEARRPFRDFQYRFAHPDGRTLHFLVNGKPVFDEAGAFLGYRGVGSDITARVEAEEQARSARERLALAVDGLAEQFVLFDADDRIVLTNAAWRELNRGMAEATVPGTRFEDFLRAAVAASLMSEAAGQEEEWLRWRLDLHRNPQGPFEIQREDGRWILINEQRLPDGGTVLIGTDITERKRAEEALHESERRFRNLVDGSVQGILIHRDRRPLYVNRAWAEIHGYTMGEVMAMESVLPLIAPSEQDRMAGYRKRRMEGGEAPSWYEYEAVRKDSSHISLENMASAVTWDDEPAILSTVVNVTERKRAEEALRESEERLRAIFDSLVVTVISIDDRGVVQSFNPGAERIFGYAADEVLGRNVSMLMPEPHRAEHDGYIANYLASGESKVIGKGREVEGRRKDGSLFPMELEIGEMVVGGRRMFVGIAHDITERKQAEEQRLALEREVQQAGRMEAIGQLAGGIAHEINTPVQYIGDNLRFLDEAWRDLGPVVRKYRDLAESALGEGVLEDKARAVQSAAEEADLDYLLDELPKATRQSIEGTERVARIVLAMKEFSHPSAKEKVAADLNRAIQSTVTVSGNEWKHVAEVDFDLDETLAPVVCLAGEMNQVFLNLIVNAAHAIAAKDGAAKDGEGKGDAGEDGEGQGDAGKGRITVSTCKDGEWVEIRIADTGAGIPEDVQDKIFNPFFTTKEVGRGTGQGLAICRDIVVNKHGGKIFFDSKEGEGTTFVVRLPLDSGQSATEAA